MAISKAEAAMYAYITGRVLPKGTTRAVLRTAYRAAIGAGTFAATRVSPPVARGALGVGRAALGGAATLARRQPVVAGAATLYALNELGHLEPVKRELAEFPETFREALPRFEGPHVRGATDPILEPIRKAKKKVSKFNKAISAGMKAVKKSTSYGKKGTISNAKKAFSAVTKTVSKLGKRKTPTKGIMKVIASTSAAKRYKDEILRRKMK
jgi:hypothetical protein